MSATNNRKQHYQTIDKTCYTANIVYLFIHVFYVVLFAIARLNIMAIIASGVVAIYLLFFLVLNKKKYYLYALLCGNEFFVFVIVATTMLGFNTGFHFYLIGLCVVSFFTTYFQKNQNSKGSLVWTGMSVVMYLLLYLCTTYNPPYYQIEKWVEMTLFILHAVLVFGFVAYYMLVFVKYAKSLEAKITFQSRTDELTQISNRYGLYDYYEQDIDKEDKVLALFDIDDFKGINDHYGHVTGDYILKRVAEIASNALSDAFICRYGGEEFVIILNEEGFFDKLEEFRKAIEKETFEFEGNKVKLTITIGAKKYQNVPSLQKWVDQADEKMYEGKNSGKNKVVI